MFTLLYNALKALNNPADSGKPENFIDRAMWQLGYRSHDAAGKVGMVSGSDSKLDPSGSTRSNGARCCTICWEGKT